MYAWWAGMSNRVVVLACQAGNRFLVSLTGFQIWAQLCLPPLLPYFSRSPLYFLPPPPDPSCLPPFPLPSAKKSQNIAQGNV
jgi:hypothetical protein